MKLSKDKIIKIINVLIVFTLTICIADVIAYFKVDDKKRIVLSSDKEMKSLLQETDNKDTEETNESLQKLSSNTKPEKVDLHDLKYYRNYYGNDDIVGTLKIDGTSIYTLLAQGNNNKFYLNHSLYGKYDGVGTSFVDYRTKLSSKQINIYGHNSRWHHVMFKDLEKYLNKNFYKKHKYIKLWDGNKESTYEIFSVQIVKGSYEHMKVNPSDQEAHIEKLKESIYDTGIDVNVGDELLILQTCSYKPKNSFLIVSSKKIREVLK